MKTTDSIPNEKLTTAIEDILTLSCESFSRIKGIAKCILAALESNHGAADTEAIAYALKSIILDSDMVQDDITYLANINGVDETPCPRWVKRLDARPTMSRKTQGVK